MNAKDLEKIVIQLAEQISELKAEVATVPAVAARRAERARVEKHRGLVAIANLRPQARVDALHALPEQDRTAALAAMTFDVQLGTLRVADDLARERLIQSCPSPVRHRLRAALMPVDELPELVWLSLASSSHGWSRSPFAASKGVGARARAAGLEVAERAHESWVMPPTFAPGDRVRVTRAAVDLLVEIDGEFAKAIRDASVIVTPADENERRAVAEQQLGGA